MHFWLFFRQTNKLGVYTPHRDVYSARHSGSVAERLKAPVLKTGEAQVSVGSNPTLSAMRKVKRKALFLLPVEILRALYLLNDLIIRC